MLDRKVRNRDGETHSSRNCDRCCNVCEGSRLDQPADVGCDSLGFEAEKSLGSFQKEDVLGQWSCWPGDSRLILVMGKSQVLLPPIKNLC